MKRIGRFLLFFVCFLASAKVQAAELVLNPNLVELKPGESKTIDIVSNVDASIIKGSMVIVTSSNMVSLVSVTVEDGIIANQFQSTISFTSRKPIVKGQKIGTINIKSLTSTPLGSKATITVGSISLETSDGQKIKGTTTASNVKVSNTIIKSTEATLESITSKEIEIPFSKDKYEYKLNVKNNIKKLNIKAIPTSMKAKVSISNQNLQVGENEIIISVLSESGNKKEYKLFVNREENPQEKVVIKKEETSLKYFVLIVSIGIITVDLIYILKYKNRRY